MIKIKFKKINPAIPTITYRWRQVTRLICDNSANKIYKEKGKRSHWRYIYAIKQAQRPDIISREAKVFTVQTFMINISTPCHTSGELDQHDSTLLFGFVSLAGDLSNQRPLTSDDLNRTQPQKAVGFQAKVPLNLREQTASPHTPTVQWWVTAPEGSLRPPPLLPNTHIPAASARGELLAALWSIVWPPPSPEDASDADRF